MSLQRTRNILLLGTGNTTSFINICEAYSKRCEFQGPNFSRTTVITERHFTLFDEELRFIDTPQSCQLQNLYKVLRNYNAIDAILVFADSSLSKLKLDMQRFFTASNYPREKIIFIIPSYYRELNVAIPTNSLRTMVNLQNNLKQLDLATSVVLGKNVFFVDVDFFANNEMSSFRYALKDLFALQPCGFQFTADPNLPKTIAEVYSALIEVLQTFSRERRMSLQFLAVEDQYSICKICLSKMENCGDFNDGYGGNHGRCHRGKKLKVEAKNCSPFKSGSCESCTCLVEQHVSLRWKLSTKTHSMAEYELEKVTLQHILATLHLFCERSGLSDVCKDFNKEYWSLVKRRNISKDDSVYAEIEDKIKELEPTSHQHTPEEIGVLLQHLRSENWCSFDMKPYFQDNSELRLIANTNLSSPSETRTTQPSEVAGNLPLGGVVTNLMEVEKDAILESLRKEVGEIKMEKVSTHKQISELKQTIENLQ